MGNSITNNNHNNNSNKNELGVRQTMRTEILSEKMGKKREGKPESFNDQYVSIFNDCSIEKLVLGGL